MIRTSLLVIGFILGLGTDSLALNGVGIALIAFVALTSQEFLEMQND